MEVLLSSVTTMWKDGKGLLGELIATDRQIFF